MTANYCFKYIIIGDAGVGKSSLLTQFIEKKFNNKYSMTVGVEFLTRTISIQDETIKLQIWDTSGQESFRSITRSYYRSAAGAILVYDITKRETFANIIKWLEEAKQNGNPEMSFILIGNKSDLNQEREISQEEGTKFAEEHSIDFIEASAKTGNNVEEGFLKMTFSIHKKIENGKIDLSGENIGIKKLASKDNIGQETMQLAKENTENEKTSKSCCIQK